MIYTVTLNPALDKTVEIPSFTINSVNRANVIRTDPAGKGINVSRTIQKLGSRSTAMGILAGTCGRQILDALREMGIETDFIFTEGETRTNLKITDPVLHTNTDINEPGIIYSEPDLRSLSEKLRAHVRKEDIVIFSGKAPSGSPPDIYRRLIQECNELGARVILDADGQALAEGIQASPYIIKPNSPELSELVGRHFKDAADMEASARAMMNETGISKIVVSMGDEGLLYVTSDQTVRADGLDVPVKGTVGAGDSVVAALAVSEEKGLSAEETVRLAAATGTASVMYSGTQAPEYETVLQLLPYIIIHTQYHDY